MIRLVGVDVSDRLLGNEARVLEFADGDGSLVGVEAEGGSRCGVEWEKQPKLA